jgi:hypothetical protein
MKTTASVKLFALAALVTALVMGGCMAQPAQQCQAAQPSTAILGLPQFWVQYKLTNGTGACSMLLGDEVGFQTYTNPKDDTDLKVAIRAGALGTQYQNGRVDPADPDGKKINSVVKITAFPDTQYVCKTMEDIPEAVQNFEATSNELDDGGMEPVPALTIKYKWKNARWLSSPSIPGQVFEADLDYTEDTCMASYKATGLWPLTSCFTNADCSPLPLPDAKNCTEMDMTACADETITNPSRTIIGSGINPDIKVKCDRDVGVCVMSESFDDLANRK